MGTPRSRTLYLSKIGLNLHYSPLVSSFGFFTLVHLLTHEEFNQSEWLSIILPSLLSSNLSQFGNMTPRLKTIEALVKKSQSRAVNWLTTASHTSIKETSSALLIGYSSFHLIRSVPYYFKATSNYHR